LIKKVSLRTFHHQVIGLLEHIFEVPLCYFSLLLIFFFEYAKLLLEFLSLKLLLLFELFALHNQFSASLKLHILFCLLLFDESINKRGVCALLSEGLQEGRGCQGLIYGLEGFLESILG